MRANERTGASPRRRGRFGSGVASGAGPAPAEGTQLGSTTVPPFGTVPPVLPGPVVVFADVPPLAPHDDAGTSTTKARARATARRIFAISDAGAMRSVPHDAVHAGPNGQMRTSWRRAKCSSGSPPSPNP